MPTKKRSRPKRDELNADPYRLQRAAERKASRQGADRSWGVSKVSLPGKHSFVGANRQAGPNFDVWWKSLRHALGGLYPSVEAAHAAYISGESIGTYAHKIILQRNQSSSGSPCTIPGCRFTDDCPGAIALKNSTKPLDLPGVNDVQHNHPTRVILAEGKGCPACDAYHQRCRDRAKEDEEKTLESFPNEEGFCDECGAGCINPTSVSRHHRDTCSLHPDNVVNPGFVSVPSGTQVRPVSSTDPSAACVVLTRAQSRAIHDRLDVLERDLHAAFREIVSLRSMFR